jgi:hypothetical protein
MNIICLLVSRHNLKTSLKCLKRVKNRVLVGDLRSMSQKVDKNKTYIAVNIAENSNGAVRRTFLSRFRRNASTNDKKDAVSAAPRLNKTDLARLLSLAKPEKWKLIGI